MPTRVVVLGLWLPIAAALTHAPISAQEAAVSPAIVHSARVTVLSTMLADTKGVGEWGFAALVETDGHRLLFDTGARPDTVLANARELGIDLTDVRDVVLSHHHADHTGGLLTLRRELAKDHPEALSRVYVLRAGLGLDRRTCVVGAVGSGFDLERGILPGTIAR